MPETSEGVTNMAGKDSKSQLIEAACRLFQERGYEQVTVSDICAACGVTKTAFYYHFTSKEELLLHLYREATRETSVIELLSAKDSVEQILLFFQSLLDGTGRLGSGLTKQLLIANVKEDRRSFELEGKRKELLAFLIQEGQKAGQIRNPAPADRLCREIGIIYLGCETQWCVKGGRFDREDTLRRTLEDLLDVVPERRWITGVGPEER